MWPFSGNVITLDGHSDLVNSVGAIADGLVLKLHDMTMKVWNGRTARGTDLVGDEPGCGACGERLDGRKQHRERCPRP